MFKRKNRVGRPSNSELKNRKVKKLLLVCVPILLICIFIVLITTGSLSKLSGNSVINYYCDTGYKISGSNCIRTVREKAYRVGDVNKDDNINIVDYTSMKDYYSGKVEYDDYQLLISDVNSDGKFNDVDMTILRKYIGDYVGGSSIAENSIGNYICPKDYKLINNACEKEEIVPAQRKEESILYGDVNKDGVVNNLDKVYLTRYLTNFEGYTLDEEQKKNADVNSDTKIDDIDRIILTRHLAKWDKYKKLPYKGIVEEDNANIFYGDVNKDGVVNNLDRVYLTRYLANFEGYTLDEEQKKNADVNSDTKIDDIDRIILTRHLAKWDKYKELPYKGTVEEDNIDVLYGDVNLDGKVNLKDVIRLAQYVSGENVEVDATVSDINKDTKIDDIDKYLLNLYVAGWYKELPYTELNFGDVNLDGVIDITDATYVQEYIIGSVKLDVTSNINADVNMDSKIDNIDVKIIQLYVAEGIQLPYKNMYGDVNLDGKVNLKDVITINQVVNKIRKLDLKATINADINLDTKIDDIDKYLLNLYVAGWYKELPYTSYKAGDINIDGKINKKDSLLLKKYINNKTKLSNKALINADINLDGTVDSKDHDILKKYLAGIVTKIPVI